MDTEPARDTETDPPASRARGERHGSRRSPAAAAPAGPFLPLLLLLLAVAGWLGLQTWILVEERGRLRTSHAAQQTTVDNATKLRTALDTLAADTQRLADAGNPNARLLVEELRKRGVTINAAGR